MCQVQSNQGTSQGDQHEIEELSEDRIQLSIPQDLLILRDHIYLFLLTIKEKTEDRSLVFYLDRNFNLQKGDSEKQYCVVMISDFDD